MSAAGTARHLRPRPGIVTGTGTGDLVQAEFAKDRWDAFVLGIPARRGRNTASFTKIEQSWLREAVKTWCRFRLGAGYTFNTIDAIGQNMARFSRFLAGRPDVVDTSGLSREVIEAFLLWMATTSLAASPATERKRDPTAPQPGITPAGNSSPHRPVASGWRRRPGTA
jgi:hypothetical protein